jgi:uncharacterized protein YggE
MIARTVSLLFAALLATSTATFAQGPSITVNGEASVSVAPDLAQVEGGVTSEARTAREASDANNKAMAAVLAALKGAGVAEADIQTARLSLAPQSAPARPGSPPTITGYRASNRVIIRVREIGRVAGTLDTLLAAGANEIGGINFMVSQESKALDEARAKAIEDARRKAEIYARAAGVRIGSPLSISEEGTGGPVPMPRAQFKAGAAAVVAPGEETLKVSVTVAYEIVK